MDDQFLSTSATTVAPRNPFQLNIALPIYGISYAVGMIAVTCSNYALMHMIPLACGFLLVMGIWFFADLKSETRIRRFFAASEFLVQSFNWGLWFPEIHNNTHGFSIFYLIPVFAFINSLGLAIPRCDCVAWICFSVLFLVFKLPFVILNSLPFHFNNCFDDLILFGNVMAVGVVFYIFICNVLRLE